MPTLQNSLSGADGFSSADVPLPQTPPPMTAQPPAPGGAAYLRRRALAVWLVIWALGALPSVLRQVGGMAVSPAWEAFGWGLWLPGAGFASVGGWALWMFPLVWGVFQACYLVWSLSGLLLLPMAVWLGAAIWAALWAGPGVPPSSAQIVPLVGVAFVAWKLRGERREQAAEAARGQALAPRLPALLADLEQRAAQSEAARPTELSRDALAAARYVFDLALQPVGQFEGFNRIDNFQAAALRYQLNYISYSLAALQCRYTPNFHGYLNQAQRYAIESLVLPQVCGYWKWEHLAGRLRWNPDPIGTIDNVMLTGWSLVALSTYAANTGDLRYQKPGALPFRPFRSKERTYDHDANSFTASILRNFRHSATSLYACEPFWVFPLCNAYAYCGLVAQDRVDGHKHATQWHPQLLDQLEADFMLKDGTVRSMLCTLSGWSWMGGRGFPAHVTLFFLLSACRVFNAFHPGYARRWYVMLRDTHLSVNDGELQFKGGVDWADLFDMGHYRKGVGQMLAMVAQAAREHGDDEVAEAALRAAGTRLQRIARDGVMAYEGVSNVGNINLAAARWLGPSDWLNLIVRGPDPKTFEGPVLTGCRYPDVLVALARGDAQGLNLVLYPGVAPAVQTLRIERLRAHASYLLSGAVNDTVVADGNGAATLRVPLQDRTELRLQRLS